MVSAADLADAFSKFDLNGDGTITEDEMVAVLTRGSGANVMDEEAAKQRFKQVDTDGNGAIDYLEFVCAWGDTNPRATLAAAIELCADGEADADPIKVLTATLQCFGAGAENEEEVQTIAGLTEVLKANLVKSPPASCGALVELVQKLSLAGLEFPPEEKGSVFKNCVVLCKVMDAAQQMIQDEPDACKAKLKAAYNGTDAPAPAAEEAAPAAEAAAPAAEEEAAPAAEEEAAPAAEEEAAPAAEAAPAGPKCWEASPEVYKDITPAEGPPPGEGLKYLDGCKLIEMKLAPGAKDKPCYHDKHYIFIIKGGKVKITGGPAGPGNTAEMELVTGSGAVMPAGDYEKENVGDGDLEVLILEVGSYQDTTPEKHYSCLEAEPTHYKCVAEDEDWMVITMDMDPGEEDKPHSHREHIVYVLSEGELSIWGGDKKTDPEKPDVGPVPVKPGAVLPVPTGYHIVKNSGDSIHVSAMFFERKH